MDMVNLAEQEEKLAFVKEAAEAFSKFPEIRTYARGTNHDN